MAETEISTRKIQEKVRQNLNKIKSRMDILDQILRIPDYNIQKKRIKFSVNDMINELQDISKDLVEISKYTESQSEKSSVVMPDLALKFEKYRELQVKMDEIQQGELTQEQRDKRLNDWGIEEQTVVTKFNKTQGNITNYLNNQTVHNNGQLAKRIQDYYLKNQVLIQQGENDEKIGIQKTIEQVQSNKKKINFSIDQIIEKVQSETIQRRGYQSQIRSERMLIEQNQQMDIQQQQQPQQQQQQIQQQQQQQQIPQQQQQQRQQLLDPTNNQQQGMVDEISYLDQQPNQNQFDDNNNMNNYQSNNFIGNNTGNQQIPNNNLTNNVPEDPIQEEISESMAQNNSNQGNQDLDDMFF